MKKKYNMVCENRQPPDRLVVVSELFDVFILRTLFRNQYVVRYYLRCLKKMTVSDVGSINSSLSFKLV